MTTLFWVLLAGYVLIGLRWAWGAVEIWRTSTGDMRIPPLPQRTQQPGDPALSILIAAHNEGDHIERCLNHLREQNYPMSQIVVVNDRSTDETAAVVRRLSMRDPRITLVNIDALPDGWIGKTHALASGAVHATGDYLLFVDSDVFLHPGAIAGVMETAIREKIDFLTLWPRLGLRSLADRLLVPPTGWLLSFWAWSGGGTTRAGANPIMGNGQFLLVARNAYDRIGGHAAVKAELAEDAVLAHHAHAAGLRRWVGLGHGLYVTARHSTFARCCNGMARVMIGTLETPAKILLSTQIILGGCVTPFWIFPLALWLYYTGHNPTLTLAFAGASMLHVTAMFITLRRLFSFTMEERGGLWLYPFGCLGVVGILLWSLLIMTGRGSIRWGATKYSVSGSQILRPVQ